MAITSASLKAAQVATENRYWDERSRRWRAEDDERQRLAIVEGHRRRPKWAIEHLHQQGRITSPQREAADRLAAAIEAAHNAPALSASSPHASPHTGWDLTCAAEVDRVARLWSAAQSREVARGARSWVSRHLGRAKGRMPLYDRLFAFPLRSWTRLRTDTGGGGRYEGRLVVRVAEICDAVDAYWQTMDAGYGPQISPSSFPR